MRRTVILSRGPFAVLAAVVLLALFVAVGDAGAAPSGSIAGSVTSDGGKPAAGICVRVDELVDGDRQSVGSATTELDGTYVVTDLAAGQYLVEFADCNDGMLVQQWWQGAPDPESATPITLADAEQRTGIDATMQVGGTIRGRVTDVGGAPLEDLCVIGVRGDADQISGIGFARTEPDGTYVMSGVSPGATRVLFEQCDDSARLVPQWFDGADSFGNATVLTVVAGGELTAIDGQLRPAAAVAGRVTNTAGDPVGDVCVQATSDARFGGSVRTDGDGTYELLVADAGSYRIQFLDCNETPTLAASWWGGTADPSSAVPLALTPGDERVGIDAVLKPGAPGAITGTVRNLRGDAMTGACVVLYAPDEYVRFAPVEPDGSYAFEGVPSGTFSLVYVGCDGPEDDPSEVVVDPSGIVAYPAIWWGGQLLDIPNGEGPDPIAQGATLTTVAPGQTVVRDVCFGCDAVAVGSVSTGSGSVTLTFDADAILPAGPSIAAASAATSFRAECSAAGAPTSSQDGTSSPITVTGLRGGTTYRCVVLAYRDGVLVGASEPTTVVMAGGAAPDIDDLVPGPGAPAPASAPASASATPADGSASAPRSLAFVG